MARGSTSLPITGLMAMKKILHTDIVGQQGVNLIEKVCLDMGYLWHPTGL